MKPLNRFSSLVATLGFFVLSHATWATSDTAELESVAKPAPVYYVTHNNFRGAVPPELASDPIKFDAAPSAYSPLSLLGADVQTIVISKLDWVSTLYYALVNKASYIEVHKAKDYVQNQFAIRKTEGTVDLRLMRQMMCHPLLMHKLLVEFPGPEPTMYVNYFPDPRASKFSTMWTHFCRPGADFDDEERRDLWWGYMHLCGSYSHPQVSRFMLRIALGLDPVKHFKAVNLMGSFVRSDFYSVPAFVENRRGQLLTPLQEYVQNPHQDYRRIVERFMNPVYHVNPLYEIWDREAFMAVKLLGLAGAPAAITKLKEQFSKHFVDLQNPNHMLEELSQLFLRNPNSLKLLAYLGSPDVLYATFGNPTVFTIIDQAFTHGKVLAPQLPAFATFVHETMGPIRDELTRLNLFGLTIRSLLSIGDEEGVRYWHSIQEQKE